MNRLMKSLGGVLIIAGISCPVVFSQAPTTQPQRTPEQIEIIRAANTADISTPQVRLDLKPNKDDGTPNPEFGKPSTWWMGLHDSFMKRKEKPIGLLFLGDSITSGWGGKGKTTWDKRYAKHDAANFGIGGDGTQHVLWRIENGELDGIKPKVVVLMIGTNNSGRSAEDITKAIKTIVTAIQKKLPESKLLLLGIFPRSNAPGKDGQPNAIRTKLQSINAELAKLDDGKQLRYLEIWKPFLDENGFIPKDVMPDTLHPSDKGYEIWADAMQPLLDEMMK